jgi:hypothetical protein
MKRIQKIAGFLMRPRQRGFSRIDFFVLLFLAAVTTVNMLAWTMQPSQPAAPAYAISAATEQSRGHTTALAIPQAPAAPVASRAARAVDHAGALAIPRAQQAAKDACTSGNPIAVLEEKLGYHCYNRATYCSGGNYVTNTDCIMAGINDLNSSSNIRDPFGSIDTIFLVTAPYVTVAQPQVIQLWQGVLTGVNAFCIVLLALTGVRIMLGGSVFRFANAIEMIPRILLALIAAQLSLGLMTVCIALNDYSIVAFYNYASTLQFTQDNNTETQQCQQILDQIKSELQQGINPIANMFSNDVLLFAFSGCPSDPEISGWEPTLQAAMNPPNSTGFGAIMNILEGVNDPTSMMEFITEVMVFMLLGQIVVRMLFLDFYIIVAPLGLGASAFPGRPGQTVTRMWIQGFTSTLFSQFLQVTALIVIRILGDGISEAISSSLVFYVGGNHNMFLWLVQIAEYWFVLRIPSLLSTGPGSPMNLLVGFGQTISQLVQMQITQTLAESQEITSMATMGISSVLGVGAGFIGRLL